MLAGIGAGVFAGLDEVAASVAMGSQFRPVMAPADRTAHLARWQEGIARTRSSVARS